MTRYARSLALAISSGALLASSTTRSDPSVVAAGTPPAAPTLIFKPFLAAGAQAEIALTNGIRVKAENRRTILVADVGVQVLLDGSKTPSTCSSVLVSQGFFSPRLIVSMAALAKICIWISRLTSAVHHHQLLPIV